MCCAIGEPMSLLDNSVGGQAMIISLVQTKGGTGKSTLSQCLAFSSVIRRAFDTIALVELDEQRTLQRWWQKRLDAGRPAHNIHFHHLSSTADDAMQKAMASVVAEHDLTLIDVPGESVSRFHTGFACAISDLVLIPMRTSTHDEDAFENLLPIIEDVIAKYPEKSASFFVIPAFCHPRTTPQKIFSYFQESLPAKIGCLPALFPFRSTFENFNREGMNLYEYIQFVKSNRRDFQQAKTAEAIIQHLAKEIMKRV